MKEYIHMRECIASDNNKTICLDEDAKIVIGDYVLDLDVLVKRFGKRVLFRDSEGVEINVDDIVYGISDGKMWVVNDIIDGEHPIDAEEHVLKDNDIIEPTGKVRQLKPEWLTHVSPDTQEKIDTDAMKNPCEYFDCIDKPIGFDNCDAREMCSVEQKIALLRRQNKLDKRTMNR